MATMAGGIVIPMPGFGTSTELQDYAEQLKTALEAAFAEIASPAQTYASQNNTGANVVRTIDCNAPVLATTTRVLATLITDLQNKGILKR